MSSITDLESRLEIKSSKSPIPVTGMKYFLSIHMILFRTTFPLDVTISYGYFRFFSSAYPSSNVVITLFKSSRAHFHFGAFSTRFKCLRRFQCRKWSSMTYDSYHIFVTVPAGEPLMTFFIEQGHYILLTSHSHFYFLHENCLEGLSLPSPSELTDHLIRRFGVISEKPMHCVTRRANNRFKIPANTRFYRVKVKPHPTG